MNVYPGVNTCVIWVGIHDVPAQDTRMSRERNGIRPKKCKGRKLVTTAPRILRGMVSYWLACSLQQQPASEKGRGEDPAINVNTGKMGG